MARKIKRRSAPKAARRAPAAPKAAFRPMSMTILSLVHFAIGALFALFGLFMLLLGVGTAGIPLLGGLFAGIAAFAGIAVLVFGALGLAAGWGLWKMMNYGRLLASLTALTFLTAFPVGTVFGLIVLYWLWVRHDGKFR